MRTARQGIEEKERELEDKAFEFLDRIADGVGFDLTGEPFIEAPFDPITDFVDDPDGLIDGLGDIDPFDASVITEEPVLDPDLFIDPDITGDTIEAPANADGTVDDTDNDSGDATVDPEPTDGSVMTEPAVEPVQ